MMGCVSYCIGQAASQVIDLLKGVDHIFANSMINYDKFTASPMIYIHEIILFKLVQ